MNGLPSGTVTFLFTDIVGSTELAQNYPGALTALLARHNALLRQAVHARGGQVFQIVGDAFKVAFESAPEALAAALDGQRFLHAEPWDPAPVRVRMGIHTGAAQAGVVDDDAGGYTGYATLARAQRIMSAGHGGQLLLSNATAELVRGELPPDTTLRDLGEHRLKGLINAERLWQVVAPGLPHEFSPLQTLDVLPNNLPSGLSRFVGRERELARVKELVVESRLLTLLGPGGTGKTRLALQAARDLLDRFQDRVYLIDLAPFRDPESALAAIARTLGIRQSGSEPLLDLLKRELRDRKTLLLLDNMEQVLAAAPFLAELLQDCPALSMLVTSREALRVRGEQVLPVPPLNLPGGDLKQLSAQELAESEAVQLFVERARAVKLDFALTNENAAAVAEICLRLDGLPLAIELATARLNILSPQALLERLGSRLKVLRGGARDLPARQQTLRSTIDWSYEMLNAGEQRLFALLSVFSGATFSAVEAVADMARDPSTPPDILEGLGSLVDKSLIRQVDAGAPEPRLTMLETIREYATARLDEDATFSAAVCRAHANYFADYAQAQWQALTGAGRETALAQLDAEIENIRTAWRYWVAERNLEQLHKFTDSLWQLYDARGWYHATVALTGDLLQVLSSTESTPERALQEIVLQTSLARALLAIKGFTPEVERAYTRALELCQQEGEVPQLFPVLRGLAMYHLYRAEFQKALRLGERILTLADHLNDPAMRVEAHLVIGSNLASADELTPAVEHLEQAIAIYTSTRQGSRRFRLGTDPGIVCYSASALFHWMQGLPDRAQEHGTEALALARRLEHPFSTCYALFHNGVLQLWLGNLEIARARSLAMQDVAEEHEFQVWNAVGSCLYAVTHAALGSPGEGLSIMQRGIEAYQGLKTPPVFFPLLLMLEAGVYGLASRPHEGLAILDEAIRLSDANYGKTFLAEFFRLKGELLLGVSPDNLAPAEEWLERAMNSASKVGLTMPELRAAMPLSRLWQAQGKRDQAHALLAGVYGKFTEGWDTADLKQARALLDELESAPRGQGPAAGGGAGA